MYYNHRYPWGEFLPIHGNETFMNLIIGGKDLLPSALLQEFSNKTKLATKQISSGMFFLLNFHGYLYDRTTEDTNRSFIFESYW